MINAAFAVIEGGYSHAPDDLSYGVDMKKIRWFGILQVLPLAHFTNYIIPISDRWIVFEI